MSFSTLKEELNCSICLGIYVEPVTLSCGHSFCDWCIQQVLDSQESSRKYFCPDCRRRFRLRPAPHKNTTLCGIVKHFQSVLPEQSVGNVFCTYCMQIPLPAVKSCVLCEASLCKSHVIVHSKSPEHVLVNPTISFHNRKCSVHSKALDYFNPEDARCVYCAAGVHRRSLTPQQAGSSDGKSMKEVLETLTLKRKRIEDQMESLQVQKQEVRSTANRYLLRTCCLFNELKTSLCTLRKRTLNEISRQEKQISLSLDDIMNQLEVRKHDMSTQIEAVKEISSMTSSVPVSEPEIGGLRNIEDDESNGEHQMLEENVHEFIPILISETLQRDLCDLMTNTEPLYFGTEAVDISLDADTAGKYVVVSRDQKTASWSRMNRSSERFQACNQVLSTRDFAPGKYYWEIESCKNTIWRIGVTYPSAGRRNPKSRIGDNNYSWCLCRHNAEYSVRHDKKKTTLSRKVSALRLGVYLNSAAGRLTFYELGDPIVELYTYTAIFSEPLYAALYLARKGSLRVRDTR